MAWKYRVLVVANVTVASQELVAALSERAREGAVRFTLLVPARGSGRGGREGASKRLDASLERLRAKGLEVEGRIGDSDPVVAVQDVWDPGEWDEIIVSTLPTKTSKWLQVDLPHRVERMTGIPVRHVVAREERPRPRATAPPRSDERWGLLTPLRALGFGRRSGEPTR